MELTQNRDRSVHRRKRSEPLTPEGFDALLAWLGPDREQAGQRYVAFRRRLVRLFDWRGCLYADDLADEVLNRAARRMAKGLDLRSGDPFDYFRGIAHRVFKETLRQAAKERRAVADAEWPPSPAVTEEANEDLRLRCLHGCLYRLPAEERHLVLRYHSGADRIETRRVLAGELGVSVNTLRIRVYRLRRKLESCIHERLHPS